MPRTNISESKVISNFTPKLLADFNNLFSLQKFDLDKLPYDSLKSQVPFLERLAEVEGSNLSVLDLAKGEYYFIKSKYTAIFGYNMDPRYYMSLMHPKDLPILIDTYFEAFKFMLNLPIEERKDYKLILNSRQKNLDGTYSNLIVQLVVLELDPKGNIWLVLIIDDLIPETIKFSKVRRRLVNIKNNKIFKFKDADSYRSHDVLSSRETEILELISKGLLSKEIADKLFLSVNTVNNHRQKILEKINATNTMDAIMFAKKFSLI